MAYKQKSKDISGLMMKMKSPLNYGGKSAMMKTGEPEKTSKDLKSTKILKAVGGEEAMAKAYTKQTGVHYIQDLYMKRLKTSMLKIVSVTFK